MASWFAQQSLKPSDRRITTPRTLALRNIGRIRDTVANHREPQQHPTLPAPTVKYSNDTPLEMSQLSMSQFSEAGSTVSLQSKSVGTYRGSAANQRSSSQGSVSITSRPVPVVRDVRRPQQAGPPQETPRRSFLSQTRTPRATLPPGTPRNLYTPGGRSVLSSADRRPFSRNPYTTSATPYSKSFPTQSTLVPSRSVRSTGGSTFQSSVVGRQPTPSRPTGNFEAFARKQHAQCPPPLARGGPSQHGGGAVLLRTVPQAAQLQVRGTPARSHRHAIPTPHTGNAFASHTTYGHNSGSVASQSTRNHNPGPVAIQSTRSHNTGSVASQSARSHASSFDEKQFVLKVEEEVKKQIDTNLPAKITPMIAGLEEKQDQVYRRIRRSEDHCQVLLTCIDEKATNIENRASNHVNTLEAKLHSKGEALLNMEGALSTKVSEFEGKIDEHTAKFDDMGGELDHKMKKAKHLMDLFDRKVHDANENMTDVVEQLNGTMAQAKDIYKKLSKAAHSVETSVNTIKEAANKGVASINEALASNFKDPMIELVKKSVQDLVGRTMYSSTQSTCTPDQKAPVRTYVSPTGNVGLNDISNIQGTGSDATVPTQQEWENALDEKAKVTATRLGRAGTFAQKPTSQLAPKAISKLASKRSVGSLKYATKPYADIAGKRPGRAPKVATKPPSQVVVKRSRREGATSRPSRASKRKINARVTSAPNKKQCIVPSSPSPSLTSFVTPLPNLKIARNQRGHVTKSRVSHGKKYSFSTKAKTFSFSD